MVLNSGWDNDCRQCHYGHWSCCYAYCDRCVV